MPKQQRTTRRAPAQRGKSLPALKAAELTEPTETPTRGKKHHIQPKVLEIIRRANGEPVTLKQITDELLCPDSSVQHAILKLRETVPQIEVVTKGQVWKWDYKTTDLARSYAVGEDIPTQPPVPAQRPAPAVETEVPGPKYEERYTPVGIDQLGRTIVRNASGDEQLYVLDPL